MTPCLSAKCKRHSQAPISTTRRSRVEQALLLLDREQCKFSPAPAPGSGAVHVLSFMGLPCAHMIQERWYDRAGENVLKLEDIHPHWRFTKPPQTRQATTRQEDQARGDDNVTDVPETSPPPPEDGTLPDDILRVQEPAVVKPKGRP